MPNEIPQWLESQRQYAEAYLRREKVDHLGVGEYPAFHVHPYLTLWAVQSRSSPGSIGWWAVTGDLPADYISATDCRHPRDALRVFARNWQEIAASMLAGESHPESTIGTPEQWPELGNLLRCRADIIQSYADEDKNWEA